METKLKHSLSLLISFNVSEMSIPIHLLHGEMDKVTFDQYIKLAKDAFKALGVKTDRLDDLGSLPESELPTKEVAGLRRKNKQLEFVVLFD